MEEQDLAILVIKETDGVAVVITVIIVALQ
jgi:hypothetical protein